MTIKIVRNDAGNCITFEGSSNPVYFNACLSGQVDPTYSDRINVINDIATAQAAETVYEFYQLPYTEFRDSDNNPFATAADAAAYITAQGNVISVAGATYLGTWDADANSPALVAATHAGNEGDFYYVSADGTTALDAETSWRRGDKVIWNGSAWQKLKATSVIDGTTYSTLLNTQTSVYSDGEGATADESGIPGWYYRNTENNKINWYVYGDTPSIRNELGDLSLFYAVVTPKNTTSEPYFSIYTKVEGDGDDQSWYRSRVTYYDQSNLQTMVAGTKYLVHSATVNGALLDSVDQILPRISLGKDASTTAGPEGGAEELFLLALSTSSNFPAGTNEFTVEKIGYVIGDHQQEFNLSAAPTTGASTFDQTPSDLDFQLEATGTTILANDGQQYSVNSIHAIDNGDGTIDVIALPGQQVVYDNLDYSSVTIAGSAAGTNVGSAVNALNALFTNLPLGAGGTYQPTYPVLDAANVTVTTRGTVTPTTTKSDGTTVHLYGQTSTSTNADIVYSTETIDAAGEFYTVKIAGGGRFLIGLGSEADGDRTELASPGTNAAAGLKWSQAFYDYGTYTAPWTIYGSTPGLSYGPGWSFSSTDQQMRYNNGVQNELNGAGAPGLRDGALFKIGIDQNGYITCWYYDEGRSNQFIMTARSTTVTPAGEYFLVVKLWDGNNVMVELPQRSAVDDAAPVLNYRFIESPDGAHTYPLFATSEEAAYVDEQFTGTTGEVTSWVFVDEPTGSTWYKPVHVGNEGVQFAPSNTDTITYTEIPTLADDLYAPASLNIQDYTVTENQVVNIQIVPQDVVATVTGLPAGLTYSNGYITGTAGYVIRDEADTVTVERSNSYGTTTETFTITVTDDASLSDIAGFTETQGNFVQPNRIILTHDALLQYDTQINPGEELTYSYGVGQYPPTIGILSDAGETNLANFDPALNTLGDTGSSATDMGNNFAWTGQWDLRYVTGGQNIGGSTNLSEPWFDLVGWSSNDTIVHDTGSNIGAEFKLEYGLDGYIRLYRDGVLQKTSANTFSGAQTLTFVGFNDQQQTDVYVPSNLAIATTGAGSTTPPTGFVDPVESGEMASTTTFGNGTDSGVVFLTETLKVNHRYIVPRAWIEANVLPNIAGAGANASNDEQFLFGVPKTGVNWATVDVNHFHACFRVEGTSSGNLSRLFYDNSSTNTVSIASITSAFYDYAIEWDGTDLHVIACNIGDINTQPGINNGGSFSRVGTFSNFAASTGSTNTELNLVIAVRNGAQVDLTTTGLQQIRIPFGARDVLVGEASGGGSMFITAPAASVYDSHSNGHASTTFGMSYTAPTLNAGYTYRFIYHPSLEAGDDIKFTRIDDGTDYTTGVTFFDGTSNGDPNFDDGYKGVTFAVPSDAPPLNVGYNNDYQGNTSYVLKPLTLSGSTYVAPVTGVTQEGPVANQTGSNIFDAGDYGWLSIDEQLGGGERLVLSTAFLADLADAMPVGSEVKIGLKDTGWTSTTADTNFEGALRLVISKGATGVTFRTWQGNTSTSLISTTVAGITSDNVAAFFDLTSSGNNIRFGIRSDATNNTNTVSGTPYADWNASYKVQTGDQGYGLTSVDVMVLGRDTGANAAMNSADVAWTALSEIAVPTAGSSLTTPWTKALDFSGSAERTQQVNASALYTPLKMAGSSSQVSDPAVSGNTVSSGHPWATACVFKIDGNSSNQHIWNLGEGAGDTDDNIYLRVDANQRLYFGWGRSGSLNECYIHTLSSAWWYGIYVGFNGARYGAAGSTASRLDSIFTIRLTSSIDSFGSLSNMTELQSGWTHGASSTGGRMDRQFDGDMTIGGRGANRNFHGKVASMVVTTLRCGQPMPDDTEINMMIRDPQQWLIDYKAGNPYRRPSVTTDHTSNFTLGTYDSLHSTQVWLMGDSPNDAYAQIRNYVWTAEQNRTPMNMISMVSNDIETVNIPGLS